MKVKELSIAAYRNLKEIHFIPVEGVNVIYGDNGQGKTNLLEAVWIFTGSRSFRNTKETEMIPLGESFSRLELSFENKQRNNHAVLAYGQKKKIALNEISLDSSRSLIGNFHAVVFDPGHLYFIKGGPAERRRAVDMIICQLKPRYVSILSQYARLLDQRNRLLKDIRISSSLLDTLDIWDQSLAKLAALIIKTRTSFIDRLQPYTRELHFGITSGKEELTFHYHSSVLYENSVDEDAILKAFKQFRNDDIKNGMTSIGPHRDDIDILLNKISARLYGSQGQQRSAVLSLKLGECALVEEMIGEPPVILLDDVMSELDEWRRDYLLHHLTERQIFITCCDAGQIRGIDALYKIEEGRLV